MVVTPYAFQLLTVGTLIFLLGVAVVIWERAARVSMAFLAVTLCAAIWLFGYAFTYSVTDERIAFRFIQLAHLGVTFIPSFVLLFILMMSRLAAKYTRWIVFSFILSALFYALVLFDEGFLAGTNRYSWGLYPQFGLTGSLFLVFFFFVSLANLILLGRTYQAAVHERSKKRIRALMIAFCIGYLGCYDFFPAYGFDLHPFGYIAVFFFVVISAAAIGRYHLIDITPAFAASQILETMQGAVFVVDLEGVIRVANRAARTMLGYSHLQGMQIARIIESPFDLEMSWDSGEKEAALYNRLIMERKGELRNIPMVWRAQDDRLIRVSVSVSILKNQNNIPDGIVYVALDMTEKRRAEETLRANEEKLRTLVETARDGIITADDKGIIVAFNQSAEGIFGYSSEEIIGKPLTFLMPERYWSRHQEAFKNLIHTGQSRLSGKIVELSGLNKSGAEFPIELSISHWTAREKFFATAFIRDISDRKKEEETLQRQKDLDTKSQFVSMVSHELRTPLTSIKMAVDILIRGEAGETTQKQQEWLDMAHRNIDRLARLITQVLDFQRLEQGRIEYDLEPINLWERIQEVTKTVQPLIQGKPVVLEIECPDSFPKVYGDKDKLSEILMNYIGNAAKFTDNGKIIISAVQKGSMAEICVADTGIGIKEPDMEKLFKSFARISGNAQRKMDSSGLGLAITKRLVEQQGGNVRAESTFGKGSRFYFQIPLAKSS